ncbi:hypothetical protein C8F04DRAFT_1196528 [Mycena alexandri]|uniref:Uncharacterized protein n=1 Tax=Mycena alexandri TaxID=1745969 RepID=A0AAD6S4X2_9AGAR|nr:hypothetical protein C8F04DRAFT_1196528 [Mycena alexandri]
MPPGRKPLDPAEKAEHRQASLRRYAEKNREALRVAARAQSAATKASSRRRALQSAAKYREKSFTTCCSHTAFSIKAIMAGTASEFVQQMGFGRPTRSPRKYIDTSGLEAFDEKSNRKVMAKTQRASEAPARTRAPVPPAAPRRAPPPPAAPPRARPPPPPPSNNPHETPNMRSLRHHRPQSPVHIPRHRSSLPEDLPTPRRPFRRPQKRTTTQAASFRAAAAADTPCPPQRCSRSTSSSPSASEDSDSTSRQEELAKLPALQPWKKNKPLWAMPRCPCGKEGCPQPPLMSNMSVYTGQF